LAFQEAEAKAVIAHSGSTNVIPCTLRKPDRCCHRSCSTPFESDRTTISASTRIACSSPRLSHVPFGSGGRLGIATSSYHRGHMARFRAYFGWIESWLPQWQQKNRICISGRDGWFGESEVQPEQIWTFPEGLLGFGDVHEYVLLRHGEFECLQAVQDPALAFRLVDPPHKVSVGPVDLASIKLTDAAKVLVKIVAVICEGRVTANAVRHGSPDDTAHGRGDPRLAACDTLTTAVSRCARGANHPQRSV